MNICILGATGMLGHKLLQQLSLDFNTYGTIRGNPSSYSKHPLLGSLNLIGPIDVNDINSVYNSIDYYKPDVIINCIGIIKQLPEANNPVKSIYINSLYPQLLAQYCISNNIRLIHYSTDCVFSGKKGYYSESDYPDCDDLYGRTKLLGEVTESGCLTLRTSIIGRELHSHNGLIEWFLNQEGKSVYGYTNAIFSGLSTIEHAKILHVIISKFNNLSGVFHLAAEPISKYDLLNMVNNKFNLGIDIIPDDSVLCNRSLNNNKFYATTHIPVSSWDYMIEKMYQDSTQY
jgi:dTDP-4-dehydrorhamnose reductase